MDILNKIGQKTIQTYKSTAEMTSRFATEIKIKNNIADQKDVIEEIYKSIGQKVYERYLLDTTVDIDDHIKQDLLEVDTISEQIKYLNHELMDLKQLKQCPNCYEKLKKESNYCSNCGVHLKEEDTEEGLHSEIILETDVDSSDEEAAHNIDM